MKIRHSAEWSSRIWQVVLVTAAAAKSKSYTYWNVRLPPQHGLSIRLSFCEDCKIIFATLLLFTTVLKIIQSQLLDSDTQCTAESQKLNKSSYSELFSRCRNICYKCNIADGFLCEDNPHIFWFERWFSLISSTQAFFDLIHKYWSRSKICLSFD